MNSSALENYIEERYGNALGNPEAVTQVYLRKLKELGRDLHAFAYGFFISKEVGDALIVYDLYTIPEERKKKRAWDLFKEIRSLASELHKNVIIGFSEFAGRNHEDGRASMKAAGFKKAFETEKQEVYIRGVY